MSDFIGTIEHQKAECKLAIRLATAFNDEQIEIGLFILSQQFNRLVTLQEANSSGVQFIGFRINQPPI